MQTRIITPGISGIIITLLVAVLSVINVSADSAIPASNVGMELGYFSKADLSTGQSGCWYYHPADRKHLGKVVGLGDNASEAIALIINGKKITIGNWRADYQNTRHRISYDNDQYQVDIFSEVLSEGRFSTQTFSTIRITRDATQISLKTFGECGS